MSKRTGSKRPTQAKGRPNHGRGRGVASQDPQPRKKEQTRREERPQRGTKDPSTPRQERPPQRAERARQAPRTNSLADRILALLEHEDYQPLDKVGLSKALGIHSSERRLVRDALDVLEAEGAIVRIRKDRYVIPQAAQMVTGRIEFHRNGTAHVISDRKGEQDIFITASNCGTALHGDRVVVRLDSRATERLEGAVIRILQRATQRIVGTLQRSQKFFYVIPDDPRMAQDIYVEPSPAAKIGYKVVVRFENWDSRHVNPEGSIVEVLGPAGAPGVDMLGILRKYDLPEHFPDPVLDEADRIPEELDPDELDRREDCRSFEIVTIDPDDAKDFDDAIHVERIHGGWRLQVHIADVSHYVTPGSVLDIEASKRGNSTYLVDRVIPMLPERLSNGICSLKPKVERLTFAAFIDFDAAGKVTQSRFGRAVIRSAHRYTYKEAFAVLQKKAPESPIEERLHTAWELAALLRRNRFTAGSLDLDFPEIKIRLDDEGRPERIERIENDISHQLIEEFMLAANEAVAGFLMRKSIPAVYRVHEKPAPDRLREFREIAMTHGLRMGNPELRSEIQRVLREVRGQPEEFSVKVALLRRLMRARYDIEPLGHYGLAKGNYTHFTSPIRRYADLIVHRSLAFALERMSRHEGEGGRRFKPHHLRELGEAAEHISMTERASADAEQDSVQLKKMDFFERQLNSRKPLEFRAAITEVRSFGLIVDLPDAGQSGMIHVSSLGDEFFQFDQQRQCLFSRRGNKRYGIGDELTVIVSRVDRIKRQVDFVPIAAPSGPGEEKRGKKPFRPRESAQGRGPSDEDRRSFRNKRGSRSR